MDYREMFWLNFSYILRIRVSSSMQDEFTHHSINYHTNLRMLYKDKEMFDIYLILQGTSSKLCDEYIEMIRN